MAPSLDRGYQGEQAMGFILGQQGYEFIAGPSGAGGHVANASGFDGVAYNPTTDDLIIGDNKTFKRTGNVTSATALAPEVNLEKNLTRMIEHIETDPHLAQFPNRGTILNKLRTAEQSLTQWKAAGRPPGRLNLGGVRLVVFNAHGNSTGVGGKLRRSGAVHFEDLNEPPRIRVATEPPRVRVATEPPRVRVATEPPRVRVATEPPRVRVVTDTNIGTRVPAPLTHPSLGFSLVKMVGPAVALGILQWGMKYGMVRSLENLKQPQPDPRAASSYFSDPNTAQSIRFIDLLKKNLKPLGRDLESHHASVVAKANAQVMLLAGSRTRSIEQRIELVSALRDELLDYGDELDVVFENLEAVKGLSTKVESAAQGAEQMAKSLDLTFIQDQLLKTGFDYNEIVDLSDTLKSFSSTARQVFRDVEELHAKVRQMRDGLTSMYWQLLQLSWFILLTPLIDPKPTPPVPKPGLSKDAERVLRVLPTSLGHRGLSPEEIYKNVRQDGGDFIPGIQSIYAALRELEGSGMVDSVSGSLTKKGGEYSRNSRGDVFLKGRRPDR